MCLYFNHNNNANLYFTTGGLLKKIPPVVQAGNEQADGISVCGNLEVQQFSHR